MCVRCCFFVACVDVVGIVLLLLVGLLFVCVFAFEVVFCTCLSWCLLVCIVYCVGIVAM